MKKNKKLTVSLGIVFALCIFASMIFTKSGYKKYTNGQSFGSLVDVLLETSKDKENVQINEKDINAIGSSYFRENPRRGKISINGFNTKIENDKVKFLVPIKYKFLPLLISTEGKININSDYIIYNLEKIKVGKITLPKGKALDYLAKHSNNKIKIQGNKILIPSNILSDKMKIVSIQDGKVIAKASSDMKNIAKKVDKASKILDDKELQKQEIEKASKEAAIASSKNVDNNSKDSQANQSSSKKQSNNSSNKNNNNHEDNISSHNNNSSLSGRESEMISIMNSTIDKLDSNPSYNYWGDVQRVLGIYETLPSKEKAKFKSKVYNYVDVAKAKRVKEKMNK